MASGTLKDFCLVYFRCLCDMIGRFFLFFKRIPLVDDKAVFITGCDSGFGRFIALNLNETGFTVFAGCLFPEKEGAKSLEKECKFQDKIFILPLDVKNEESIKSAFDSVKKVLFGNHLKLWAVINNAGITSFHEFEWGSIDLIRNVMEVNVLGMAAITRQFLPLIRISQGRIVNINSVASRFAIPQTIGYDMSKHASLAFVEGLRREMFKFGVKVISIEPFMYKTNITDLEILKRNAEKIWSETSQEIKDVYGQEYFDKLLKFYEKSVQSSINRDPIEVTVEVNHAITAVYPKMTYAVGTWYVRCLFSLIPLMHPQELVEMAINLGSVINGTHRTYQK